MGTQYNEIFLSIFSQNHKVEVTSLTNYAFKYRSSTTEFTEFINLSTGAITGNNLTPGDSFSFEFVIPAVKSTSNALEASYFLKIYNTTTLKTNEILTTLAFTNNNSPLIIESKTNTQDSEIKFTVTLENSQNYTAIVYGVTSDKEYFTYTPYSIVEGKPVNPSKPDSNLGKIILIVLLVLVIIAIIIALVFVYFTLKKKKNVLLKNVEHISFANEMKEGEGEGEDHLLSDPINSFG